MSQKIQDVEQLIQDEDFLTLQKLIEGRFNLFKTLDLETKELIYSRMIRWLLDPNEDHNLEGWFLINFLKKLYNLDKDYFERRDITYIDIDCLKLNKIRCTTEQTILSQRRIDIFVEIRSEKWIIVIENKIDAEESPNQTKFYNQELQNKQKYQDFKKICIFLTKTGERASSDEFLPIDYKLIRDLLVEMENELNDINSEKKVFIQQFKDSIELYVMENEELNDLIEKLHEKYGDVFEFLFEQFKEFDLGTFQDLPKAMAEELDTRLGNDWKIHTRETSIDIIKKSWVEIQKQKNWDPTDLLFRLFRYYIKFRGDKIQIILHGNIARNNKSLRENFRKELKKEIDTLNNLPYQDEWTFDQNSTWLKLTPVDDIKEIGNEEAINEVVEIVVKLIETYTDIIDNVVQRV
ncbi:MAG: PD-(D/E)XK nuclease family protein [Promethearchaeia archaeon]